MKRLLLSTLVIAFTVLTAVAQTGNVGIGTNTPDPSSMLDITSDTSGVLIPRMTTEARDLITSPATGLMIFDTTLGAFCYYTGSEWAIVGPDPDWTRSGNYVYNATDSVGIGTSSPRKVLEVDGDIKQRNTSNHTLVRTMPDVVDDYVDIGHIVFAGVSDGTYGGTVWITISMGSAFPVTKSYILPITYNQTNAIWEVAMPVNVSHYNGAATQDFDLDIRVQSSTAHFRIRRSSGIYAGMDAYVVIRHDGATADAFTETFNTGTAVAPTTYFTGSAITTVGLSYTSSNVGIGTMSPSQKLDVEGNAQFNGYLTTAQGIRTGGIGDPGPWALNVTGQGYVSDYLQADGGIHVGGASDPGTDNLIVDGISTFTGDVFMSNSRIIDGSFDLDLDGTTNLNALVVNSTFQSNGVIQTLLTDDYDKIRVYPSSSYTIGMKSAQSLGFLNDWATTFTMSNSPSRGWLWRDVNDAASDGAMSLTTDGRLYVKSTAAFNGNIGIGTTTPTTKLQVESRSDNFASVRIGSDNANDAAMIFFTNTGDWNIGVDQSDAGKFKFGFGNWIPGNATRLTITSGGNVGIGTTNPVETLDVDGTMRVGSGSGGGGLLDVIGDGGLLGNVVVNRVSSDGTLIRFRRDGGTVGTITVTAGTVSYTAFTGSHYAWTNAEIDQGSLVSLTGINRYSDDNPDAEIIYGVVESSTANDPKILGTYLGLEGSGPPGAENPHLVAAVGNGDVWVVDAGENIAIGDYLISSDVPGHAIKDNGDFEISYIIARAAEPVDWETVSETVKGRKHKKISVLFESFVSNHALEKALAELRRMQDELDDIKVKLAALDAWQAKTADPDASMQPPGMR